jgi:hypothetical protein
VGQQRQRHRPKRAWQLFRKLLVLLLILKVLPLLPGSLLQLLILVMPVELPCICVHPSFLEKDNVKPLEKRVVLMQGNPRRRETINIPTQKG